MKLTIEDKNAIGLIVLRKMDSLERAKTDKDRLDAYSLAYVALIQYINKGELE